MSEHDLPPAHLGDAHRALEWVREAGELTLRYFGSRDLVVDRKGDGTPVTAADREAEHLLRNRIAEACPEDGVRGEEHDDTDGTSGRTWVIDPIDGTTAFSRGVGTYSNLLYLEDELGPAVGIINLPALGECVWAVRGHGCFVDDTPVVAGAPATPEDPSSPLDGHVLCVSGFHCWDADLFERARSAGAEIRTWGDAYGYALVATRRADAMFDPLLEWWDLAAPLVVIREAGATITRRDGGDAAEPSHDGPYGLSAIASSDGVHQCWIDLLAGDAPAC